MQSWVKESDASSKEHETSKKKKRHVTPKSQRSPVVVFSYSLVHRHPHRTRPLYPSANGLSSTASDTFGNHVADAGSLSMTVEHSISNNNTIFTDPSSAVITTTSTSTTSSRNIRKASTLVQSSTHSFHHQTCHSTYPLELSSSPSSYALCAGCGEAAAKRGCKFNSCRQCCLQRRWIDCPVHTTLRQRVQVQSNLVSSSFHLSVCFYIIPFHLPRYLFICVYLLLSLPSPSTVYLHLSLYRRA